MCWWVSVPAARTSCWKPGAQAGVVNQQDFDGNGALDQRIAGTINRAHGTAPDALEVLISADAVRLAGGYHAGDGQFSAGSREMARKMSFR